MKRYLLVLLVFVALIVSKAGGQTKVLEWIRPDQPHDAALWGIRGGIVFSLWPYGLESQEQVFGGGPRGLIRVGVERGGKIYLLNFLAIEPVVDGQIEFSEISPSRADNVWGKLMWAEADSQRTNFYPTANTRGTVRQSESGADVEELSIYVSMERFNSGAEPYLRLFIRSDRPDELGIQLFNRPESTAMDFCTITATMGNYSRLRKLYLNDEVIDSRTLFAGYNGIDFTEKDPYGIHRLIRTDDGGALAVALSDESLPCLKDWPDNEQAKEKSGWRYRADRKYAQYWRVGASESRSVDSLFVRVNGRYAYWSGGSREAKHYMPIPGGTSFENFEMRACYRPGQTLYFGITEYDPVQIIKKFSVKEP